MGKQQNFQKSLDFARRSNIMKKRFFPDLEFF